MTSAREVARGSGKGENVDRNFQGTGCANSNRLTAMFNPKKRVPATVEFTDLAATGQSGVAKTLVDVAPYKNADALVHVLRAFQDPRIPHPPARSIRLAMPRRWRTS
jgi:ribosome-binding ATPase YchF (GTP1/OBG family)